MIFDETLQAYKDPVKKAVSELFRKAYRNQVNDTDLLLVLENGLKQDYSEEQLKRLKITPYSIGPEIIGLRYNDFYKFINEYRKVIFKKSDFEVELKKQHSERNYFYNYTIEQELLIYLKFWETDLILRRLYNLSRLARGLEYDWEYNQDFFNDRRKVVRDEIQNNLKLITPKFYNLLDEIYNRQIRNAVGHSQFYFLYDSIHFTNKKENSHYKLSSITLKDWEILFHKNILFYNFMIYYHNFYSKKYQEQAKDKHFGLLISFPEKNTLGNNKTGWVKYDKYYSQWRWDNK
jgi:hypothetical protein